MSSFCRIVPIRFHLKYFRKATIALLCAESGGTMLNNKGYFCLLDRSDAVEAYDTCQSRLQRTYFGFLAMELRGHYHMIRSRVWKLDPGLILRTRTRQITSHWEVEIAFYDGPFLHGNGLPNEEPLLVDCIPLKVYNCLAVKFSSLRTLTSILDIRE